jgi:hypothetical protein
VKVFIYSFHHIKLPVFDFQDVRNTHFDIKSTWTDNKVRILATVCLPWQQWTETSEWFDDVGISEFRSCVVVDLLAAFF